MPGPRRWLVLIAAVVVQVCLGGVYAWSAFVPPLRGEVGLSTAQAQAVFGVTLATFTLTMVLAGRLLPRVGPRVLMAASGLCFGLGYLVSAWSGGAFLWLLLGVGALTGIGIGCGYVCPIAVGVRWFPRNKGLVSGLAVAAYASGAVLLVSLTGLALAAGLSILAWFVWIGIGYGLVLLLVGQGLAFPDVVCHDDEAHTPLGAFWASRCFWAMALGMSLGTFAGLMVIGNLLPIGLTWGLPAAVAALAVSVFALANAAGRLGWGALADRTGPSPLILAALVLSTLSLLAWPTLASLGPVPYLVGVALIALGYAASFVLFANLSVRVYGHEGLTHVYPWVLVAYGLAALLGPVLGGWLRDTTGTYTVAVLIAGGISALGAAAYGFLSRVPTPVVEKPPHAPCINPADQFQIDPHWRTQE